MESNQTKSINIEKVIQCYDATICSIPGLRHKFAVEAIIRRIRRGGDGKKFRVMVDSEILTGSLSYYHLVLAEEAGHFIADGPTVASVKSIEDTLHIHNNPEWMALERNREMIGRVWLAPNTLLESTTSRSYSSVVNEEGFSNIELAKNAIHSQISQALRMPIDHVKRRLEECSLALADKVTASLFRRDLKLGGIYSDDKPAISQKISMPTQQRSLAFET